MNWFQMKSFESSRPASSLFIFGTEKALVIIAGVHWGLGIPFQELSQVSDHVGKQVSHLEENFEIDVEEEGRKREF